MKTIFLSVITRHTGHWPMFNSVQMAAGEAHSKGYKVGIYPHVGDSLVSRARNTSLMKFINSDYDYYFTLDDDIGIPSNTLWKLADYNLPLVGGMYRLKQPVTKDTPSNAIVAIRAKANHDFSLFEDKLVEVDYLSGGCMMHTKQFCIEMTEHYPELKYSENITKKIIYALYQPYIYNDEYLSEDWAFCQRALDKNYKIYLDTSIRCDHWGLFNYNFVQQSQ